eukprot:1208102-Prymnesium_polylepis.1
MAARLRPHCVADATRAPRASSNSRLGSLLSSRPAWCENCYRTAHAQTLRHSTAGDGSSGILQRHKLELAATRVESLGPGAPTWHLELSSSPLKRAPAAAAYSQPPLSRWRVRCSPVREPAQARRAAPPALASNSSSEAGRLVAGLNWQGHDLLGVRTVRTALGCREACAAYNVRRGPRAPACRAFTFIPSAVRSRARTCWLKGEGYRRGAQWLPPEATISGELSTEASESGDPAVDVLAPLASPLTSPRPMADRATATTAAPGVQRAPLLLAMIGSARRPEFLSR